MPFHDVVSHRTPYLGGPWQKPVDEVQVPVGEVGGSNVGDVLESWVPARRSRSQKLWKMALQAIAKDSAAVAELQKGLLAPFDSENCTFIICE